MKIVLIIAFLFQITDGFSQSDSTAVSSNKIRISQLNQRLDNLLEDDEDNEIKSLTSKVDVILSEIERIKIELERLIIMVENQDNSHVKNKNLKSYKKENLTRHKAEIEKDDGFASREKELEINKVLKEQDLEGDGCYVVLVARRDRSRAEIDYDKLSKSYNVQLVRNSRDTWYHIILKEVYIQDEVRGAISKMKDNGFEDAWWTSGRKLVF
jgi:hypothetical protein